MMVKALTVPEGGQGKSVPVNVMKAYRGSKGTAPLILNLDTVISLTTRLLYPQGRNSGTQ
jgi:hypothetical protein